MLNKRGTRPDLCGIPLLSRFNLLRGPLPAMRMKLRLPSSFMMKDNMCLSGRWRRSLQLRPRCQTVSKAAIRSANTACLLFCWETVHNSVICKKRRKLSGWDKGHENGGNVHLVINTQLHLGLGTHLFVKVSQPVYNEGTFSVFDSNCHQTNYQS